MPRAIFLMIGLQRAGNETELLPGRRREGRFGAPSVAGVEIIFFTAADMVTCFRFVTKTVLITQ